MKAIQYTAFGDSSVIHMNQVDKPVRGDNEVLIKITALSSRTTQDQLAVAELSYL